MILHEIAHWHLKHKMVDPFDEGIKKEEEADNQVEQWLVCT